MRPCNVLMMTAFLSNSGFASEATVQKPRAVLVEYSYNKAKKYINQQTHDVYLIRSAKPNRHIPLDRQCHIPKTSNKADIDKCMELFTKGEKGFFDALIVGPWDSAVSKGAKLRTKWDIPLGTKAEEARFMFNKAYMKRRVSTHGAVPLLPALFEKDQFSYDEIRNFFAKHPGGIVIKPTTGTASMGVNFIHDLATLEAYFARRDKKKTGFISKVVVEKYVSGEIIMIDGYSHNGKVTGFFPVRQEDTPFDFYQRGKINRVTSAEELRPQYRKLVQNIITGLQYKNGVFHLEIIHDDAGNPYFLEIAARPGMGLSKGLVKAGYDTLKAYIHSQLNQYSGEEAEQGEKNIQSYSLMLIPSLAGENLGKTQKIVRIALPEVAGYVHEVKRKKLTPEQTYKVKKDLATVIAEVFLYAPIAEKKEMIQFAEKIEADLLDREKTLIEVL